MKKFTESVNNIKKIEGKKIIFFDLFPLLKGLESERPGIKDRVWKWLCSEWDVAFKPYNGRILNINLFYFGVGEEYTLKNEYYEEEVNHSKKIHPNAFKDGEEKELRLDLNLIWHVYEDENENPELFSVITQW